MAETADSRTLVVEEFTFHRLTFNTDEHEEIGKRLTIGMGKNLTLPNGVRLQFAYIVALAGDFYGIPKEPIVNPLVNPNQSADSLQRFKNAYSTLANTPHTGKFKERLEELVEMIRQETDGPNLHCHHSNQAWDEASGGWWIGGIPIWPGNMLKLAHKNFDHFGSRAKRAYETGHGYAIEKAREAGRSMGRDREKLRDMAYSIEAFALHFFTDAFASGHIRTPRAELQFNVTPSLIGDLLSKFMHDEDNKFGLRVTNLRGDTWIAYGDGMLIQKNDKDNFNFVAEAAQTSVDQVFMAYQDPDIKLDPCEVTDFLPFLDEEEKNNTPLFQIKDGELHRRSDINDLQCKETTTDWWGSTTAWELWRYKPKNPAIPLI
ncbi:uncharacterized protein LOC114526071 [Dendronephthya gigantea]|uniref:uncharacterized protein LOC114526071 n=1 Tax=Dendronephthya gigantea TaxID=151771 RepID=UPI00106C5A4E|nr:uncharacterized protein LOC114526071 [Dendronephthya gigantea]